jgi:hypothetical protein
MKTRAYQHAFLDEIYGAAGAALTHVTPATAHRLAVYREGLRARFEDGLVAAFPVVERLVGAAQFRRLSAAFAGAHRSASWDLNRALAAFAGFLAAHPALAARPYVAETARLEALLHEIRFVDDPAPLAAPPAPELQAAWRPAFTPTLRLFASAWDPVALHARPAFDERGAFSAEERPAWLLVYRRTDGTAAVEPLTRAQYWLQSGLLEGDSLAEASAVPGLTAADVAALMAVWSRENLLR